MRSEWLLLLSGLLPESVRRDMFATSTSPLFVPPALTGRERDALNCSPIMGVSSRPSSPGSTTLSGYFSTLTSPNRCSLSRGSGRGLSAGHLSRTGTPNPLQKPRFVDTNARSPMRGGPGRHSLQVSALLASECATTGSKRALREQIALSGALRSQTARSGSPCSQMACSGDSLANSAFWRSSFANGAFEHTALPLCSHMCVGAF